eukprot:6490414-Amphidinium_carterae.1
MVKSVATTAKSAGKVTGKRLVGKASGSQQQQPAAPPAKKLKQGKCQCALCEEKSEQVVWASWSAQIQDKKHRSHTGEFQNIFQLSSNSIVLFGLVKESFFLPHCFKPDIAFAHSFGEVLSGVSCEGAKWAVYCHTANGMEPAGDQCESCFGLWKRCFAYFETFDDLVKAKNGCSSVARAIQQARDVIGQKQPPPAHADQVLTQVVQGITVEKPMLCITEREMRKLTGLGRIPKTVLKGLTASIQIPAPDASGYETAYLFEDDQHPYRTCKLNVQLQSVLTSPVLQSADCLWAGQSEEYQKMGLSNLGGSSSLSDLATREVGGHLHLPSWSAFAKEKLEKIDPNQDEEATEVVTTNEQPPQLVGVGAGQYMEPPSCQGKKPRTPSSTTPKMARTGSSQSILEEDGVSVVTGSAVESALDDEDMPGFASIKDKAKHARYCAAAFPDFTTELDSSRMLSQTQPQACHVQYDCADSLTKWKSKIDLASVIKGGQDKRSVAGLAAEIKRKSKNPEQHVAAQLLKNFQNVVTAASNLSPEFFATLGDADVKKNVQTVMQEAATMPDEFKNRWVLRRGKTLFKERKYNQLLDVCDPFASQELDIAHPRLSSLSAESSDLKVSSFRQLMFTDCIAELIREGEGRSQELASLCSACITKFSVVDTLLLDNGPAACHTSAMIVWRALHELLVPSLEMVGQAEVVQTTLYLCSLCKEDVCKLKQAVGQSRATLLTTVGSIVQSTPFWAQKLEDYVEKAPAMLESKPKLLEMQSTLHAMQSQQFCVENIALLLPIAKSLPGFLFNARQGCLDGIMNAFKQCLGAVWQFTETEYSFKLQECKDLVSLMSEASSLWPQDSKLQQWISASAEMLEKCGEENMSSDILDAMNRLKQTSSESLEPYMLAVKEFTDKLGSASLPSSILLRGGSEPWLQLVTNFCEALNTHMPDELIEVPELLDQVVSCAMNIKTLLVETEAAKIALCLQSAREMLEAMCALQGANGPQGQDLLNLTNALVRKVHCFSKCMQRDVPGCKHECFEKFKALMLKCEKLIDANKDRLIVGARAGLEKQENLLQQIGGGADDGKSWLDGLAGEPETFEALQKHAKESILRVSGKRLVQQQVATSEALKPRTHPKVLVNINCFAMTFLRVGVNAKMKLAAKTPKHC